MEEKKKKLLELIEKLRLPISPWDANERASGLSEEELDKLIAMYSELKDYEDDVDDFIAEVAPDEYRKAYDEYLDKLEDIDEALLMEGEKKRQQLDEKLDKIESEASEQIDKATDEATTQINKLRLDNQNIYMKMNSAIPRKS